IVCAGPQHGLVLAGYHAMNSLRLEKGYRHWGHDVSDEDTPLEAGLGFAVAWSKPEGFIGRTALITQKERGISRRLIHLRLDRNPPMVYHNEPIWRDGHVVGRITSGMFGHTLGCPVASGYVAHANGSVTPEWIKEGRYEVEIATQRFEAEASLQAFYDPT